MTLDEQIAGLEAFTTANADQFRIKNTILDTLRSLKSLRKQFEFEKPNEGKVIALLLKVIGENPPPRRPE
jgi:hypothetical protein